jgi:ABC-type glycerol-3-phosphate transport system substrate-binding protein
MKRHPLRASATLFVALILLAACGGGGGAPAPPAADTTPSVTAANPGGGTYGNRAYVVRNPLSLTSELVMVPLQ